MEVKFEHKIYQFKQASGTSRGVLTEKHAWFLTVDSGGKTGVGECSVILGLSPDYVSKEDYELRLNRLRNLLLTLGDSFWAEGYDAFHQNRELISFLEENPSICFGLETAFLEWKSAQKQLYFTNNFSSGELKIPINGLIWMGEKEFMLQQVQEKKEQGFDCIKMKVGAIDSQEEKVILSEIRRLFSSKAIIRVDANGAFNTESAIKYLDEISIFDIHSVEQPIPAGNWQEMKKVCLSSAIPVALDEELIGIHSDRKRELLETIKPAYIILKPSLHGGIRGCREWIALAEELSIGWWMTSALESNIGLNCIAQFTAEYQTSCHHGLGTGSLYVQNEASDLKVESGHLFLKKTI